MKILIIDGQGGGIGKALVMAVRANFPKIDIIAVGTNSIATDAMKKVGATYIATGENPVVYNSKNCDIILGPMGIIAANSMYGEISPKMAAAVSESEAVKYLIPISKCNINTVGVKSLPLSDYIAQCIEMLKEHIIT